MTEGASGAAIGRDTMAASDAKLSEREVLAITEWAKETARISAIHLVGKPPRIRGSTKSDIGLAVAVSSVARGDPAFGIFCSLARDWQKQLGERTGHRVSLWWFGPESPIYDDLRAEAVLIWSRS
jgi:hypothetical protein